jgi:hypothetical protein
VPTDGNDAGAQRPAALTLIAARDTPSAAGSPASPPLPGCGSVEHCFFVSKRAGLIIWPAICAVLSVVLGGITKSSLAAG